MSKVICWRIRELKTLIDKTLQCNFQANTLRHTQVESSGKNTKFQKRNYFRIMNFFERNLNDSKRPLNQ